jgi:hypothetical protein
MAYFGGSCVGWARLLYCHLLLLAALLLPRLLGVGATASAASTNHNPTVTAGENEKVLAWKATAYEELLQERLQLCRKCLRLRLRLVKLWPYVFPGEAKPRPASNSFFFPLTWPTGSTFPFSLLLEYMYTVFMRTASKAG